MVAAASPDRAAALPESPFKGLAAFEASALDAMLFFGREREREIVTANLLAARATVLYGPTGVGKSSILRAGVAHQLRSLDREGMAGGRGRELAVVVFGSWSGEPLQGVRTAIEAELFGDSHDTTGGNGALVDDLQAWTEGLGLDLYLILDQAEEYFVYHGSEGADAPFVRELAELLAWPGLRVNCLLALREEALATLDVFKARVPNLLTNRLRLEHLDREAGRAAIVGPVDVYNHLAPADQHVGIEPELVEAVLDEVATGALDYGRSGRGRATEIGIRTNIEAPFLQLVLQRLWEVERDEASGVLSLETLRRLGGAQRVVEDHLERALGALTPHEQDAAAEMFRYLVTPSGTKIAHEVSDLRDYARVPEPELERVLGTLSAERILRPVSDTDNDGGRYEIFHDVLADAVLAWRGGHEAQREVDEARREADRRHRRALVIAGVALFGLAVVAAITVFALTQRSSARVEKRRAHANELLAGAFGDLATDPQQSLALAVRAAGFDRSPVVEEALRQALLLSHQRHVLRASAPVKTASFSADRGATKAIVGSEDGTARLYDGRTGHLLRKLDAGGPVASAAFGAGARLVATGSENGWTKVWDTRSGRLLLSRKSDGRIGSVSFTADGRLLLTAGDDRNARIWDVRDGSLQLTVHREGAVHDAAFSPDGSRLLLRTPKAAWIFSRSGVLLHALERPGGLISAAFSPHGDTVVTTYKGKKALLWDALTGKPRVTLRGHRGWVTDAEFSPRGAYVVTASTDGSARVWKVHDGDPVALLPGHTNHLTSASFSPDGQWVITASRDRTARIFQATSGRAITVLAGHRDSVDGAEYAATGNRVITASADGTARIWDPGTERELVRWRDSAGHLVSAGAHPKPVTSASFSPNGKRVLITSRDGTARVVTAAGDTVAVLRNGAPVLAGALNSNGALVATGTPGGVASVWRIADRRRLALYRTGSPVRSVAFAPRGRLLLIASRRRALLWNWSGDGRVRRVGDRGEIARAAFSPDRRFVVTADDDWTAKVWNTGTGVNVKTLRGGHRAAVTAASFSPDGRMVATASRDDDGRIWRLADGSSVPLRGHDNVVNDAQFSPDGRWVVTAGPKNVGLWPTKSGLLLLYLRGHVEPVTSASFSPDGRRVLTSSEDGTVRIYRCEICSRLDGLLALAKRRLAGFAR